MSNYSVLKQDINNNIYENQTQQITGTVLNAILNEMTASLGAGYQFAGVATVGMNPGDPDQRVFYLAGEGIYTSFGGIQVPAGKLGVLKWDNRWTLQTIDGLGGGGANLTGYVSVASTDDLPDEGQPTLGYLCGTNLYLYVGEGGDTKEGKYQDCGSFRGPEGAYIQDIEQTETSHENGGRNTIKMTLSDGRSFNAYVHNGTTSSGLFPTVEALQAAYPSPVVGQYAFVGAGFPADIYVCTTAGTWTDSGEDYDGDNVDLTDYATKAEVNQLEAKVTDFFLPILSGKSVSLGGTIGATINLTPQNEGGWNCVVFPCVEGDSFTINGRGGSSTRLWGFVDSDNKLIAVSTAGLTGTNLKVVAPANSANFVSNGNVSLSVLCRKFGSLPEVNARLSELATDVDEISTKVTGLRNEVNGIEQITGRIISLSSDILINTKFVYRSNGTEGTSAYRSCTDYIPVTPGAEVKFNVVGGAESYVPSGYALYDQNKTFVSGGGGTSSTPEEVSLVIPNNVHYIRISFVNESDSRFSSFFFNSYESGEYETLKNDVIALWDSNGRVVLYNGSNGNPNNPNAVRSCVIPTNGAKYVTIKINRPNATGCHYAYAYALTGDIRDIGSTSKVIDWYGKIHAVDLYGNQTDAVIDISAFPAAVGVAITIGEFDANNTIQTRRTTDYDGYDVCVECSPLLEELVNKEITTITSGGVVERNKEREIQLLAMCRYRKTSSPIKDSQFCICTDSHADTIAVNNAVDATNGFGTIDGFIHCGDITASYYDTAQVASFQNSIGRLAKPGYIVVGNHDVGNANYVGYCCDHAQAYTAYIKPMVDKGWLSPGEFTENKPYWYHDLPDYKIRLIGLYEYDDNLDFNETYWRAITYNSGLSNIAINTAYSSGAQVNVPGYTAYSFEAVQAVTTPANYYTTPEKFPSYKVRRGFRVVRQEQAEWYLNTLLGTPADYGVVVILHNPFADDAEVMDVKFSQEKSGVYGASYSQNDMATDLIGNALVAFSSGANYSENIIMKGEASYLNTQGGGTFAYSVSKDFSSKNSGTFVLGLLGGHSHKDLVWGKGNLVQVTPICATTNIGNATSGDIRRSETDGLTKDSLTIVSFAHHRIGLTKIGVNVTESGDARDFEVISVNN